MQELQSKSTARKLKRKTKRCQHILEKHCFVRCTTEPTVNLAICNAGLVNGLSEELIYEHFTKHGPLEKLVMLPGLSCAFVSYKDTNDAIQAFEHINGKLKLGQDNKPLYLSFTETVPNSPHYSHTKLPPGLIILKGFISEEEEHVLTSLVDLNNTSDLRHRQVKHFGYEFRYDINNVDKESPWLEKIPVECDFLWMRLKDYNVFSSWQPDQLTINCYQPGQGIPPHIDTHSAFEDPLMSLSLGSSVVMDFRHDDGTHIPVVLPRRSLAIISGESRYSWTHGITPRVLDVIPLHEGGLTVIKRSTRISFTFRKILKGDCFCKFMNKCDSYLKLKNAEKIENQVAADLEKTHVHNIYENIANHFSDTRHKPWPEVSNFIQSFEKGSVLIDVGCGNGKYLGHNSEIFEVGCDSSQSLLSICNSRGLQVVTCNCLYMPFRSESANGVISIAVIHHLASRERRLTAIKEIIRILCIEGKALIYVWAKDQNKDRQKSSYLKQDRKNRKEATKVEGPTTESVTVSDNLSLPVHTNRTQFQHSDVLVPWKLKEQKVVTESFLRFYHVFEEGELEGLCKEITNVEITKSYYDQGNWCVILTKINT